MWVVAGELQSKGRIQSQVTAPGLYRCDWCEREPAHSLTRAKKCHEVVRHSGGSDSGALRPQEFLVSPLVPVWACFPRALKFSFLGRIPLLNPRTYKIPGDLNVLHPKSKYLYICQNSSLVHLKCVYFNVCKLDFNKGNFKSQCGNLQLQQQKHLPVHLLRAFCFRG